MAASRARAGDHAAVTVGEHDAVGLVCIAVDPQVAPMMQSVVIRTQADQIPRFGDAAVFPVHDVVDLDHQVAPAAWHGTHAAVAPGHFAPEPGRDHPLGTSHRDRDAVLVEHR